VRLEWAAHFPEDVATEKKHFADRKATLKATKKEHRLARRADKAARHAFIKAQMVGPTTIFDDDPS
jgi:hypothetical protein